jgi:DNA polymerase V
VQFAGRAGEKPRRQGFMAGQLLVFVMTNRFSANQPFYANSATVTLPYPTDVTPELLEAATRLLETLYRPGLYYQKCGVMLLDLSPVMQVQADLLDLGNRARETWLIRALDSLKAHHGARTVRVGNHGGKRPPGRGARRSTARAIRRMGGSCRWCGSAVRDPEPGFAGL